ncbi:MAG TPA: BTAD domain-containing putative transcriptional regulator [Euzebya sp.]|nr:BTAD domain-containing putative transcriptional regulator [Euzebya sp.]
MLGPLEVRRNGRPLALGGPKPRAVLARLLLGAGRTVRTDALIEALWGDVPPATAVKSVHKYVSRLRAELGDPGLLVTQAGGYALMLTPEQVDAARFEQLVDAASDISAATGAGGIGEDLLARSDVAAVIGLLQDALSLWRGQPFAELAGLPSAVSERARLEERRLAAQEDLMAARLSAGEHGRVVGRLEVLVSAHPLREGLWGQLMLALYRSGRQADALDAYQRLRATLADQLGIDPSSPLRQLQARILQQDPALDPRPRPAAAGLPDTVADQGRRTNLPHQLTSFIGRGDELAELTTLLSRRRLVTLTGPAGSGKTRLALELATGLHDRHRDGVWVVELAALTAPAEVAAAAAAIFRLGEQPDRTRAQVLADHLRGKQLLLVVDNCEHLIEAAAELVWTLLRVAPDLVVLATSREPLAVAGEVTYDVTPLPVPDAGGAAIERSDAVRLLVDRGRTADPHFRLTHDNAPAIARICQRLDGMPLALELAAARLRAFDAEELATALDDRFSVLRAGARTAPARHHTLRAAVDWSYDLLTEAEQVLFRRLSVFRGGFTLERATEVCGRDPLSSDDVRALLPELVDRSLVVADRRPRGGTRYRLLETLRDYGQQQLGVGEVEPLRRGHAEAFLVLAEQAQIGLHGPQQKSWLRRLDDELDNMRAALAWLLDSGHIDAALRMAIGSTEYWESHGHVDEGRAWLTRALDVGIASAPQLRSAAMIAAAVLAASQADHEEAASHAQESLRLSEAAGDELGAARSIHVLGQAAQHRGAYHEAHAQLSDALARFRRLDGTQRETALALHNLGMVARLQGDYERARALHEESLALYREVGGQLRVGYSLWMLGVVAQYQGDHAAAQAHYEEGLMILDEFGDRSGVAHVHYTLGDLARLKGDHRRAVELYEESLARLRELGDTRCVASVLRNLGVVALDRSDLDLALRLLTESLDLRQQLGDDAGLAECLEGFARAALMAGRGKQAAQLCGAAQALRDATGAAPAPAEESERQRWVTDIRQQLGREAFDRAWRAGTAAGQQTITGLAPLIRR